MKYFGFIAHGERDYVPRHYLDAVNAELRPYGYIARMNNDGYWTVEHLSTVPCFVDECLTRAMALALSFEAGTVTAAAAVRRLPPIL
jgi:hypothetical protein